MVHLLNTQRDLWSAGVITLCLVLENQSRTVVCKKKLKKCALPFRTIGVVGIDATLEEIENILLNDQWGSVYAFLINERGETIFHPLLRPSTEVRQRL